MSNPTSSNSAKEMDNDKIASTHGEVVDVPGKQELHIKPSSKTDDALAYLSTKQTITWTTDEERKVLRRIDWLLMPTLFMVNMFSLFDAQAFGISALFGMVIDLDLYSLTPSGIDLHKFSWASSIFSFGGMASLYPLLFIAQRYALGKVTAGVIIWSGAFTLLMLAVKNFPQLMALRFFYGFQSTASIALCILVTSTWYKKEEQPLRIGIWNTGQTFGSMIGQAIDYGAVSIKHGPFEGHVWKYMYLVFGTIAVAGGIVALLIIADSPMKARWLKGRERDIAVARLTSNGTGIHNSTIKMSQVKVTFLDPQVWCFMVATFGVSYCNAAISAFGALLAQSIPGVAPKQALLLLMPASAVAIVVILSSGVLSTIFPNKRIVIGLCYIVPNIVGNVLLWKSNRNDKAGLLAGLYTSVLFYGFYVQYAGLLASNVGGNTKRSASNAFLSTMSTVGSIVAPFSFKGQQATEGYPTGIISLLCLSVAMCCSFVALLFYYKRENIRKQSAMESTPPELSEQEFAFSDCTEKENPYFRYNY